MSARACFHCALPLDPDDDYQVEIDGELQPVCCPGCKAVAELIRDTGMSGYYAMRDAPRPGVGKPADDAAEWRVFDSEDMQAAFTDRSDHTASAMIYVGNMYCAACAWLIESTLQKQQGVEVGEVNPVTHRLRVRYSTSETSLGQLLSMLADLGYDPQPLAPESTARPEVAEQRVALKRLLVASLGMMQAMMFAVGLYAGDFQGIEPDMQLFLRLVSFVVTTPVVFYSARPFFAGAWRGLKLRRPGMDLPVSIAVGAAYFASIYAMLAGGEAVWFDSVSMFVFFLTLGRFLEMRARHRSIDRSMALMSLLPNTATLIENGQAVVVPAGRLKAGDRVRIRAGESIPADGLLVEGQTSVDEALLTGEARPQLRGPGSKLIAGSINLDGVIDMEVETTGAGTVLGTINRMSERARFARPEFVQVADRIASYIVVAILVLAAVVATAWTIKAPDRAFVITLSVLVVTCPCALALATPAAFAAAGTRLSELRLLLTNGNAIEALARATRIVFDKTGTLTQGSPAITGVDVVDPTYSEDQCRHIAAALETASTHPIAAAFRLNTDIVASDLQVSVGQGVTGMIDGDRWRIGNANFVGCTPGRPSDATTVYLARDTAPVARFSIDDPLRPDAAETLLALRSLGLDVMLASGDNRRAVEQAARSLDIGDYHADCTPQDKLALLHTAQEAGEIVVMVGDGINDAPVLAGANASLALAEGALLAQTNADLIVLGESLRPLATALRAARQTMRIVRQNLGWAIVYNVTAVPLAAAGLVPPWAAAIGMSTSSLIVVLNALRLSRYGEA